MGSRAPFEPGVQYTPTAVTPRLEDSPSIKKEPKRPNQDNRNKILDPSLKLICTINATLSGPCRTFSIYKLSKLPAATKRLLIFHLVTPVMHNLLNGMFESAGQFVRVRKA